MLLALPVAPDELTEDLGEVGGADLFEVVEDPARITVRNGRIGISGSVLFDLGRYEEAIQAYLAVANRYQDSPEVLGAYVEMARSYRRLRFAAHSITYGTISGAVGTHSTVP